MSAPLPNNLEAEQSVLGSLLMDRDAIARISAVLKPADFYSTKNRLIYASIVDLFERRIPADFVTVIDELIRNDRLETSGGIDYLSELIGTVPTAAHVDYYAEIVRDYAMRRRYIDAGTSIVRLGYDESAELTDVITASREALDAAGSMALNEGYGSMADVIGSATATVGVDNGKNVLTGFRDLDAILLGMEPGQLVIVAARPSIGKTSWVIESAYFNAGKEGRPVGVISLEMDSSQLGKRWLSIAGQISTYELRQADLDEHKLEHVYRTGGRLSNLRIFVDDHSNGTLADVIARCRALRHGAGVEALYIDYLQLIYEQNDRGSDNRVQELTRITRSLKLLARELQIPIIMLAQLSRALETRNDHTPLLSDLRDSGSIEQDADIVIFIHRPDIYDSGKPANVAQFIVAKNRNGPTDRISVVWRPEFAQFVDRSRDREGAA